MEERAAEVTEAEERVAEERVAEERVAEVTEAEETAVEERVAEVRWRRRGWRRRGGGGDGGVITPIPPLAEVFEATTTHVTSSPSLTSIAFGGLPSLQTAEVTFQSGVGAWTTEYTPLSS